MNSETVIGMSIPEIDDLINVLKSNESIINQELTHHITSYQNLLDMGAISGAAANTLPEINAKITDIQYQLNQYVYMVCNKLVERKQQIINSDIKASEKMQNIMEESKAYENNAN